MFAFELFVAGRITGFDLPFDLRFGAYVVTKRMSPTRARHSLAGTDSQVESVVKMQVHTALKPKN
jgi:hypothetical protein